MTDYLTEKRHPIRSPTDTEKAIHDAVERKLCKTCQHYGFFTCKALKCDCAPDQSCPKADAYQCSEKYAPISA